MSFALRLFTSVVLFFVVYTGLLLGYQYRHDKAYQETLMLNHLKHYNTLVYKDWTSLGSIEEVDSTMWVTVTDLNGAQLYDSKGYYRDSVSFMKLPEVKKAMNERIGTNIRNIGKRPHDILRVDSLITKNGSPTKAISPAEELMDIENADLSSLKIDSSEYYFVATRYPHCIIRTAQLYNIDILSGYKADNHVLIFTGLLGIAMLIVLYIYTQRLGKVITALRRFARKAERNETITLEMVEAFPENELGEISQHIIKVYHQMQATKEALHVEQEKVVASLEDQIRLKKQLSSNISHELKTPVSSIQGYLETILNNDNIPEDKVRVFLERSYAQSIRLTSLLQDISSLNKMTEASNMIVMEDINIHDLVYNIQSGVELQLEANHMTMDIDIPQELVIRGNNSLLYSVFRNLTDNAIAYAGKNTSISIQLINEDDQKCIFEVSDNGIGIDQKHIPHIFERFYRIDKGRSRKAGGTGLGLAIVKNAVIVHGGDIQAESNLGEGVTFTFSLSKGKREIQF